MPRMGVTAAFVFSAQMINFPVAGGTSGHLVGGALAAMLLGPAAAVIALTAVVMMQCLVFGDGGLLALGANVLNMAIVHPLVGFVVYRALLGRVGSGGAPGAARRIASIAFASWVATVVAAGTCAGELALSRVAAPGVVFPAMVAIHVAIGLGEALIAALVVATVLRLRPEFLDRSRLPASSRTPARPSSSVWPSRSRSRSSSAPSRAGGRTVWSASPSAWASSPRARASRSLPCATTPSPA